MNQQTKILNHSYRNPIKTSLYSNTQNNKFEYSLSDHLHPFNNKFFPLSPPASDYSPFTCQDSNSDLEVGGCEEGSLFSSTPQSDLPFKVIENSKPLIDCMGKIEEKGDCNNPIQTEKLPTDSHKKPDDNPLLNGLKKYHDTEGTNIYSKFIDISIENNLNSPSTSNSSDKLNMVADNFYKIEKVITPFSQTCPNEIIDKPILTLPMEMALSPKSDVDPSFFTSDDISIFDEMIDNTPLFENENHSIITIPTSLGTKLPFLNDTHQYTSNSFESVPHFQQKPSSALQEYQSILFKKNIINKQQNLERRYKNVTQRINKLHANCLLKHSKKEIDLYVKKRDLCLDPLANKQDSIEKDGLNELISQVKHFNDQDSDKTDSSSDDETLFDDIYSLQSRKSFTKHKIKSNLRDNCHVWKWEQTRATIAKKWIWLQQQISYLETKIGQQKDINFHLKAIKPSLKFEIKEKNNKWVHNNSSIVPQSVTLHSLEDSCARVRPLGHYSKRKLYPNIALLHNEASMGPMSCSHYFNSTSLNKMKRNKQNPPSPTKNYPWFHSNLSDSRIPLVLLFNIATRTKCFAEDLNKSFKQFPENFKGTSAKPISQAKLLNQHTHRKKLLNHKSLSKNSHSSTRKHLYNYDIDDMAITFNASATTSIILPHFDEILTPKWKINENFQEVSDKEYENVDVECIQERHTKYQLKEKSERNFVLKKRGTLSNIFNPSFHKTPKSFTKAAAAAGNSESPHTDPHSPLSSITSLLKNEFDVSNDSKSSILTSESGGGGGGLHPHALANKSTTCCDFNESSHPSTDFSAAITTATLANYKVKTNHQTGHDPLLPPPSHHGYQKRVFPLSSQDYEILLKDLSNDTNPSFNFTF